MADRSYLDWPFLADSHRELADEIEGWAATALPEIALHHSDDREVDAAVRRLVTSLGRAGLLSLCVPAGYGGRTPAIDVRSLCLARDILARHAGLADFAFAMQGLGSAPISMFGSEAQKRRHLPAVARGEAIAAFALSEPDAGSDVGAMTTRAVQDGDGYRLDGCKTWISNAGLADVYTVFARLGDAPGAKGLAAFVVEAGTPGISVERIPVMAPHPLGSVRFDGCRLPADALIGTPGDGFKIAMATLDVFRSTVGAAALGFARRALDEALARSRSRRVFGQRLADFQLTQAKIADMAVAIDAAALLVYRAAWTKDTTGGRVTREASMAKLFATESAQQVIDQAVQIFGGLGVTSGVTVEELYREIRALRIYEGASEIQKLVIAAKVLDA
ncbi:MAG TPA: acyl-CoA dehydrogenase family protein [Azospirillum sp.]|nr:acyl-CoA dehydrogenase family protein [Azospirillum sp.]